MSSFVLSRDRDAWATIRGYVYQVNLTILRWLDLEPDQMLELERGEDIDLVARSLTSASEEQGRLLEQVKHRDRSITLRSPEAVCAIANAIEHRDKNPGIDLCFRYVTNAAASREAHSTLPDAAITVWEQMRAGELDSTSLEETLQGIRAILSSAARPDGVQDETWSLFEQFTMQASSNQWLDFVHHFEWSTSKPEMPGLQQNVQRILLHRYGARDDRHSTDQYQRLFFRVFDKLSQPGIKRLTVQDRDLELALPPLSGHERERLDAITAEIAAVEARVMGLEQEVHRHGQLITRMDAIVAVLARQSGVAADLNLTSPYLDLDLPMLGQAISPRVRTVNRAIIVLQHHTWLAIHGTVATGKTQLAALVAHSLGSCRAWLRLTGLSIPQASSALETLITSLIGSPLVGNRRTWYDHFAEQLGGGALLALDDLPRLVANDKLSERLCLLAEACETHGVILLSTSPYPLPPSVQHTLGQRVFMMEAPPLTDEEVRDVLVAYEASEVRLTGNFITFVNALTQGHPLRLVALARYMSQHNWRLTDSAIDDLFRGAYATELTAEVVQRLLDTVESGESRELLYRLRLMPYPFTPAEVSLVASVEPLLPRPVEHLHTLMGVWVQPESSDRFRISPLIDAKLSDYLHPQTRKNCHVKLANLILQKPQVDQMEVTQALMHYLGADAFDQAGLLLIHVLSQLQSLPESVDDGGLLDIWADLPIPNGMNLGLRIYLRTVQIASSQRARRPVGYLVNDLDRLIVNASKEDAWAVLGAAVMAGSAIFHSDARRASHYARTALRFLPYVKDPEGKEFSFPEEARPELLLWDAVVGIASLDDLNDWIDVLEELGPQGRQVAFASELAAAGCLIVSDRMWLLEADKPESDRRWEEVLSAVSGLGSRALRLGLELLWVSALRAQLIVMAEYMHRLPEAIALAESGLTQASDDARGRFLILECIGRQYLYAGQTQDALAYLRQALGQPVAAYPDQRIHALLSASRAIQPSNAFDAVAYAAEATELARSTPRLPEIDLVKALGELAIAQWLAGDLRAAFCSLDEAAERIFDCRSETDYWRSQFLVLEYVIIHLSSEAQDLQLPTESPDGQPLAIPYPGMFHSFHSDRADLYNRTHEATLAMYLAEFAEAMDDAEKAATWRLRGLDSARSNDQALVAASLGMELIPFLVLSDRHVEALDLALETCALHVALEEIQRAGQNPSQASFRVEAILGPRPSDLWCRVEHQAAVCGLLPIAFQLGTVALSDTDRAATHAATLTAQCEETGTIASDPLLWTTAAGLIRNIYQRQASARILVGHLEGLDKSTYAVLGAIAYLGASLQPDGTLEDAFLYHVAIASFAYRSFGPSSRLYSDLALPFIEAFWKTALSRMRFRFRIPQTTERDLAAALLLPVSRRAQEMLRVIAFGLSVRIPAESVDWFDSHS